MDLERQIEQCRVDNATGSVRFLNSVLYAALWELDILVLAEDILFARYDWRRKLSARVALLSMHEFKFSETSGRELHEYMETLHAPLALKDEFNQARRQVYREQEKIRHQVNEQRNSLIGHRRPDAERYYEEILSIEEYEIGNIAMRLVDLNHAFVLAAARLLPHIAVSLMRERYHAES